MIAAVPAPKRLLLVAMDNLGDLVFTSALTPPLRHAFPHLEIDVWCKAYTADVARLIPHVNEVIAADPPWAVHPQRARPSIPAFLSSVRAVRANRYDVALLTAAPWRLAAAVWATRIPVRIGGLRRRNARFLTHALPPDDSAKGVVDDQARLLEPLGIESHDRRYTLDATQLGVIGDEVARALTGRIAALHPFAAVPEKLSPMAEWLRLADTLRGRGFTILWCGTKNELNTLRPTTPASDQFVDSLHGESLAVTAAALSRASLFVGHDSGPLHIAGAFGVPVVDVFIGGNPARYGPQGIGSSRVLRAATGAEIRADAIVREIDALPQKPA